MPDENEKPGVGEAIKAPADYPGRRADLQHMVAAQRKRQAGGQPTREQDRAEKRYKRWEWDLDVKAVLEADLPKKYLCAIMGRHAKVFDQQAERLGMPTKGPTWNVIVLLRWHHDFLAKNAQRIGSADDALLTGENSPALERYRHWRAEREQFFYERDLGDWIPRENVHEGFGKLANHLRHAGTLLQKQYGAGALEILDAALVNFEREQASYFGRSE